MSGNISTQLLRFILYHNIDLFIKILTTNRFCKCELFAIKALLCIIIVAQGEMAMKKMFLIITVVVSSLILSACSNKSYDIVTTLYPQYDIIRTIVGDKDLSYTLLLPPGAEAHGFEPTPKQKGLIEASKLFIYTSEELEIWAINSTNKGDVVDLETLTELAHDHAHGESTDEHDHEDHHDVHYWVSLHAQIHMIEAILPLIVKLDPTNEAYYTKNAEAMIASIRTLRTSFDALENKSTPIYFIGHNVFSSLNEELGFNVISLTDSFSPDADPTIEQIGSMIEAIKNSNSKYIFFDPFENDALAKTIQSDLKTKYAIEVELLPLHSMHNVSKSQYDSKITLIDLWEANFTNISKELQKEV